MTSVEKVCVELRDLATMLDGETLSEDQHVIRRRLRAEAERLEALPWGKDFETTVEKLVEASEQARERDRQNMREAARLIRRSGLHAPALKGALSLLERP
tara:strand:- start:284 stop:583 length:300 start_codon:yes stop_codon:yes gene_type:complete